MVRGGEGRRLYGLMNHPHVCKRLGALFAVRQLAKGLWRHPRIVDQVQIYDPKA